MFRIDGNDAVDRAFVRLVLFAAVAVAATVLGGGRPLAVAVVCAAAMAKACFVVLDFLERRRRRDALTVALLVWPAVFLAAGAVVALLAGDR